jgi:hypothetical protein
MARVVLQEGTNFTEDSSDHLQSYTTAVDIFKNLKFRIELK